MADVSGVNEADAMHTELDALERLRDGDDGSVDSLSASHTPIENPPSQAAVAPASHTSPSCSTEPQYLTTTIDAFVSCLNISVDCFATQIPQPGGGETAPGASRRAALAAAFPRQCKLITIDGELVSTNADVKQVLLRHGSEDDTIVLGYVTGFAQGSFSPVHAQSSTLLPRSEHGSPSTHLLTLGSATGSRGGASAGSVASLQRSASPTQGHGLSASTAPMDMSQHLDRSPLEVLGAAIDRVPPGKCIIMLHHQPPAPVRLVEDAARLRGARVTLIDAGITIHRRPRLEQTIETMRAALEMGDWLVVANATKSMSTLSCLENVLGEMRTAANSLAQRTTRVIIVTEPHPHFPKALLSAGNIVFRHCDARAENGAASRETFRESMARLRLLKASQAMLSTSQAQSDLPQPRKVRISSNVDVVSYDASGEQSVLVEEDGMGGDVAAPEVRPECTSLQGEQFTCLESAGDGRIAAGSSGGNVYLYTVRGQQLLTFHAHQCSVWALDFRGHHEFVVGSEDASLSHWSHDNTYNVAGFRGQIVTRFSSDVLAARYADPLHSDVVVAGGLNGSLCLVNVSSGRRVVMPTVSTILCLSRVPYCRNRMLMGGGTGLVTLWDCDRAVAADSFYHHKQKVSAALIHQGCLISSSFDGSIVLADVRMKSISSRLAPLGQGAVTAIAVNGNTLACAAEESLFVYDLRRPPQLLHHRSNAWQGMSRGIVLDTSEGYPIAVAASSDGIIRFFGCA